MTSELFNLIGASIAVLASFTTVTCGLCRLAKRGSDDDIVAPLIALGMVGMVISIFLMSIAWGDVAKTFPSGIHRPQ